MNYARGIRMVKKTNKPHIVQDKGRYRIFKVSIVFGSMWGYVPEISHIIMDEAASKYCRQMNQFK